MADGPQTWDALASALAELLDRGPGSRLWEQVHGLVGALRRAGWKSPAEVAALGEWEEIGRTLAELEAQDFAWISLRRDPEEPESHRWEAAVSDGNRHWGAGATALAAVRQATERARAARAEEEANA